MKIVVLDGYTLNPGDLTWHELGKLGTLSVYDRTEEKDIIKRVGEAHMVFTNKTPLTRETLKKLPNVKFIGVLATGYNIVDIKACQDMGITVTNIPTYGTYAVAQFVMALLLEVCHHVGHHDHQVKKGQWSKGKDFCFWDYPLIELQHKVMGIIGYGKIGQAVSKMAQGFGMKVISFTNHPDASLETDLFKFATLDTLLKESDVISLHCPLLKSTKGIINQNTINKMKDQVILINTSRGGLLVEEDVAEALNKGKIRGAAVDVASTEPIKMDNPLINAKNTIITPHIAWAPKEARQRLMDIAVDNAKAFLLGEPINVIQ